MEQLSFADTLQDNPIATRNPHPKPATPPPAVVREEQPAQGREIDAHKLAHLDYSVFCPLLQTQTDHCHDCALFRSARQSPTAPHVECNASKYLDPGTGKLAEEYMLLLGSPFDRPPQWIKEVLLPGNNTHEVRGIPCPPINRERGITYNVR